MTQQTTTDARIGPGQSGGKCPRCGRQNQIVNECGCDPHNMPTAIRELEDLFGPVIHRYTRRQAIDDGVLVDLTDAEHNDAWVPAMVREAGITIPVAMTVSAFNDYVCPIEGEGMELAPGQDIKGRLWDVLWMFTQAVRSGGADKSEIFFRLRVVPSIVTGRKRRPRAQLVTLKAVIGGDDNGEPCITIMLPTED